MSLILKSLFACYCHNLSLLLTVILSTKWMDTSPYIKSKILLKSKSREIMKTINKFKIQRDLFE